MYTNTYSTAQEQRKSEAALTLHIKKKKKTLAKVEPKVWIPPSCDTVIKHYTLFMEDRGVLNTYMTSHEGKEWEMLHYYKHKADKTYN